MATGGADLRRRLAQLMPALLVVDGERTPVMTAKNRCMRSGEWSSACGTGPGRPARVLGADHPGRSPRGTTSPGRLRLGGTAGRGDPLFERTLADSERVLGADHPHTLSSRTNLDRAARWPSHRTSRRESEARKKL